MAERQWSRFWGWGLALAVAAGAWGFSWEEGQVRATKFERVQAQTGAVLFRSLCVSCHGMGGNGSGGAPALDNGAVMLAYPTLKALESFIHTKMPASDPGRLSLREAQDLAEYIRWLNRK